MKTLDLSQVSFSLLFPLCYIIPPMFTNSDKGKNKGAGHLLCVDRSGRGNQKNLITHYNTKWKWHGELIEYAKLYLDGTMQLWVDAEDSLEI